MIIKKLWICQLSVCSIENMGEREGGRLKREKKIEKANEWSRNVATGLHARMTPSSALV